MLVRLALSSLYFLHKVGIGLDPGYDRGNGRDVRVIGMAERPAEYSDKKFRCSRSTFVCICLAGFGSRASILLGAWDDLLRQRFEPSSAAFQQGRDRDDLAFRC